MKKYVYVLRTCAADGSSHGGFRWPRRGLVEAPDWNPEPVCGGGLHGLLWGEGEAGLLRWDSDAQWQVVRVASTEIVELGGKVKFPRGTVVFTGDRAGATRYLWERAPGHAVHGLCLQADGPLAATGGHRSTLKGGDGSTLKGGHYSTLTGGGRSTLTGGHGSTLTGGDHATLTGGYRSTLTGGDDSTLTGGDCSSATCRWWDGERWRLHTFYAGEDYIAGKKYRFVCTGEKCSLVEVAD